MRKNITLIYLSVLILGIASLIWIFRSNLIWPQNTLFEKVKVSKSGIQFNNELSETFDKNMYFFSNFYTGSGVGIIDVNNDGLQDIFFGGNQVTSRLYLNQGGLKFEDITDMSGTRTDRWITGVSIIDINQDGYDDIYLSVSGFWLSWNTENMLFINNGDNTFSEKGLEYNLNEKEQTTHTSFFDYDRDGDLDAFLAINPTDFSLNSMVMAHERRLNGEARNTDKLFRNDGNGNFTDVSREAGILIEGYSLGVNTSDFNLDGWIDIFVTNDYITNDLLYINNGDGTFSNKSGEYFDHTGFASMGNDAGDINNDGLIDIFSLDMLPESSYRQKVIVQVASYNYYQFIKKLGYEPQYSRNVLQLNNGNNTFSEIGQLAGVNRTDWSWGALITELDNDGDKDLFITNGFRRDVGNLDYLYYDTNSPFTSTPTITTIPLYIESIKSREGTPMVNYAFKNNNDLSFTKTSIEWGFDDETYSSGLTVADLDNDGDLEIIINNIDQIALIYENKTEIHSSNHYLKMQLIGPPMNKKAIGSKITIYYNGNLQYIDHNPYRGYMSTVERNILFGTGDFSIIDSVEVIWPDSRRSVRYNVQVDTTIALKYQSDFPIKTKKEKLSNKSVMFKEISSELKIYYKHNENIYVNFYNQPLLPHLHSQLGPSIAVGDINNDGMEDFYIGGAKGFAGTMFFQNSDATFRSEEFPFDKEYEDMGTLLFDYDGDNDLDLYVVSGGTSSKNNFDMYQDRLYENTGYGRFKKTDNLIPVVNSSGGVVTAADFDGDNDLDLFVGGRVSPMSYPVTPKSYLLENRNGIFIDITKETAPGLELVGMVTSALWTDFNQDGDLDLIIVGEWLPVTVYENTAGKFENRTNELGLKNSNGWWNSISSGDINNDGNTDYLLGNLGLNSGYNASIQFPLKLIAKDFNNDGFVDPIITMKYIDGYFPVIPRNIFLSVFKQKKIKYDSYHSYAKITADELLKDLGDEGAITLEASNLANSLLIRTNTDSLNLIPLPNFGQVAPVFGTIKTDIDRNLKTDFLLIGNSYHNSVTQGPYRAFNGGLLSGTINDITLSRGSNNGFYVPTDAKALASLVLNNGNKIFLVSSNNDSLKVFIQIIQNEEHIRANSYDSYAIIEWPEGKIQKYDFHYGSGYLAQSSRFITLGKGWEKITFISYSGEERTITSDNL